MTTAEALGRLDIIEDEGRRRVHTFAAGAGLLGADWSLEALLAEMDRALTIEEAGPFMRAMGHGVAMVRESGRVLFLATKAAP